MAKNLALKGTTNAEFFELARAYDPHFRALTTDLTYKELQAGYEGSEKYFADMVNNWYNVVLAIRLQKITVADYKDVVGNLGIVEEYDNPQAAVVQRMYLGNIDAMDPAWLGEDGKGLKYGDSVDPWVVMPHNLNQMFWRTDFNFQAGTTLQPFQRKQILASDFGMDTISEGQIRQLYVLYGKTRQEALLDVLNAAINSETFPLRPTQKLAVSSWTDENVTKDELQAFIELVGELGTEIGATISTGAYNAKGFDTSVDTSNMVMLVRPNLLNMINKRLLPGIFNPEKLGLPFTVKTLKNFGGMIPTSDGESTILYKAYKKAGSLKQWVGWAESEGQEEATINRDEPEKVKWVDPNSEVLAVIAQKGLLFATDQNGINVRSTGINPRGEYENIFFNKINAGLHFDPRYNLIVITKPGEGTKTPSLIKAVNRQKIAKARVDEPIE